MLKNLFDIVISSFLMFFLFIPIFIPISMLIKCTSQGPIIFSQLRVGKDRKIFKIYKFRSMYQGADKEGFQTRQFDVRITLIGKFLRRTSLDELPQLFNILRGDMSLVGPRPDTPMQESNYTASQWAERHKVKPGITGLAQINGRSCISAEDRLRYDLIYVQKSNIRLDIKILWKTIYIAFGRYAN